MGVPKFSYYIPSGAAAGVLVFGEANFSLSKPLSCTLLVRLSAQLPSFDRVTYMIQLKGIWVAMVLLIPKSVLKPVNTGAGQTMVDFGTQFTFLLQPRRRSTPPVLRSSTDIVFLLQDKSGCTHDRGSRCLQQPLPS
ncbi:unnamed protein product [Cuscuta campestris]|uniref:Xylanase inhibitor C-terminal domain-containing protein n=1 Tax=Cuscuta campestris TaxID=132261 RepID=A0A484LSH9_9ASTE|nr:unnamed protein product [Cuscuta campestris]